MTARAKMRADYAENVRRSIRARDGGGARMTARAKHTATPWRVGMKPGPMIYGPAGEQIADLRGIVAGEGLLNACRIVLAVNTHAVLVEACRAALVAVEHHLFDSPDTMTGHDLNAVEKLRTALMAVGGAE